LSEYNPPRDEGAESLLLGTLMHYPMAYADAAKSLSRSDFYATANQLIWDVISQRIADKGATAEAVNPVAIVATITSMGPSSLRLINNGDDVFKMSHEPLTGGVIDELAQIIANAADLRRSEALAIRIDQAVKSRADPGVVDDIISQHLEAKRERTTGSTSSSSLLDWDAFFATDYTDIRFLVGRLLGEGQQMALVGDGKAGKSLFSQEWAWRIGTGRSFLGDRSKDPVRSLYLDAENGQDEIQRRFLSFGAGPGDMGELRYASFPPIPPLDTPAGGLALMAMVRETKAELVFIDTVSRFISGEENDANTWLSLYRCTLMPLKRSGIASVRLDHFGKDRDRGSRGSSAKTQDIDHVWELSANGGGLLSLRRTHTRTGIGEDHFAIRRMAQKNGDHYVAGATRHVIAGNEAGAPLIPGSVEDIVGRLDRAGVPDDWGRDKVAMKGVELGIKAAKGKWEEVVRVRKARSGNLPPNLPYSEVTLDGETCPEDGGNE
jgi:hypothetical protein